ncbi:MAG: hypothetical protein M1150_01520 [Patescibacteria group bacterium]|nr:hypothetical protein [Patescibacteria group bacterium]
MYHESWWVRAFDKAIILLIPVVVPFARICLIIFFQGIWEPMEWIATKMPKPIRHLVVTFVTLGPIIAVGFSFYLEPSERIGVIWITAAWFVIGMFVFWNIQTRGKISDWLN